MYTIKKILCPTDFSIYSKHALQYAAILAEQHDADITLLHVDEFDVTTLGYFHLHDEIIQRYRDLKVRFIKEQLDALIADTVLRNVQIEKVILPGRAYKMIAEAAEQNNYDLIVMARRGTTNLSDHMVGSTAERVVRIARCPVLTIKGQSPPAGFNIKTILCPTDYSQAANAALSYAISLAQHYGSKLYIHHISELDSAFDPDALRKKAPDLKQFGSEVKHIDIEFVFDRDIEPNNSIIRFAEDREIDLIVMSTHGQKGLRRVFIGNNTAEVVRKAECPVLTVTHPIHKVIFARLATQGKEPSTVAG